MNSHSEFLKKLNKERIYFDGGFGTMLQSMGIKSEAPELINITDPDAVVAIHKAYLDAGADVITANTFGINKSKYENYKELIEAALSCAKKAASDHPGSFIALDIGPIGRLMEPLGDLGFEEAFDIFFANASIAKKLGADLIIIETMNDSLETKAAVLAAKEACSLPIVVSNAYDMNQKLMTGASCEAMISMLEGLGANAIGLNCSFGPDIMLGMIDKYTSLSSLPIIAMPNAGLPKVENGETVYDISADDFSDYMVTFAEKGVSLLGGCCGTTPEFIRLTKEKTKDIPFVPVKNKDFSAVSSYTKAVALDSRPILIGERINPTGKSKLKEALRTENMSYILGEAISQADAGAHILDVNVGLPEIDEKKMLCEVVKAVQAVCDLPLQLDSTDPDALEAAMRIYNGNPLINSVNGKAESMERIFPLVKKYGGAVIALTIDEAGIPVTAEGRLAVAEKIAKKAAEYGIEKKNIIVDPLCLAVSSDSEGANTTLRSVELLKAAGFRTSLGVSNISFGLPEREKLNTVFFASALSKGLDCAIINPLSAAMMNVYYSYRALSGLDIGCADYIAHAAPKTVDAAPSPASSEITLETAIIKGLKADAETLAKKLLGSEKPLDLINLRIIPALNEIGLRYEQKKAYLPQLLMSAEAATAALAVVKDAIPKGDGDTSGSFVIATVKGDIHDIGKNIVKTMLESYGFKVYDLGRDVPAEDVLECVKKTGCRIVGLSALMTTTVPSMEETIKLLKAYDSEIVTVVGGAVLNKEYADMIGADHYAKDAMDTVRFAQEYYHS